MGGEETRSEEDLDYSGIVRALGSGWRWKFSGILLCALTATLLLICLAKRASRWWWWSRSRRAPPPQPAPPPAPMCTVCRDDVERGEGGVTLPCGHPYHRGCIALAVDHDPRCPVCRAPVSPGDIHSPR